MHRAMHRLVVAGFPAELAIAAVLAAGCARGSSRMAVPSPSAVGKPAPVSALTSARFYPVDFISAETGWAAGGDGIFATHDGGATWVVVRPSPVEASSGEVEFL